MPTTAEFLKAILPSEGLKCGFVLPTRRHGFFATCEELADFLLTQDAQGNTVYHACATYKTPEGRTKGNVCRVRSLWLDVDAGAGKPYADAIEAAEAVAAFIGAVTLPMPMFVASGAGLHVYWPLDQSLTPAEWEPYARGLKSLCREKGLRVGQERTGDIASILRPPGSHHRKAAPLVVRAGPTVGPFPLRDFALLRGSTWEPGLAWPSDLSSAGQQASAPLRYSSGGLTSAAGAVYEPHFAEPIAEQCAQIATLRTTRGNVPEPHWYAALGVLAFCEDGDAKAQEWSSGYPNYSAAETSRKLERAKALSGATTCEHFSETIDFNVCRSCPFFGKIKSPISLGKRQWADSSYSSSPQPSLESRLETISSQPSPSPSTTDEFSLPTVPPPFAWSAKNQLMFLGEKKDGSPLNVIVSEYPIFLASVQTGEVNKGKFSYTFSQWLPQSGWHTISVPAKILMGQGGIAEMFENGASIQEKDLFRKFVVLSIDQFHRGNNLLVRYEQFGWKDNTKTFLCGTHLYSNNSVQQVAGSEELRVRSGWLGPTKSGSLGVWRETMGELFSVAGFEPHMFCVLASFGAPLMRFNSESEGGAIVSLVSADSGTGKSTALEAAGSVWGAKRGTDLTEIDTGVSKAITLATLGNLPAIFDELSRRDPEYVRDFVLMFTNGRDKMRGTTDGTIRHMAASWQTLLLTASNLSLVDTLNSIPGTDAPSFRILEFSAELSIKAVDHARGETLRKALSANAGHAGSTYLRYLTQASVNAELPRMVQHATETLWKNTALGSHHRFWIRAIAATAVAAQIVQQLDLLPFPAQRIIDWVIDYVVERRDQTATVTGMRSSAAQTLSRFLTEHANTLLVVQHAAAKGRGAYQVPLLRPQGPHLFMRHERDSGMLYISEPVFKAWAVEHGILVRDVVRNLRKDNMLKGSRMMTLGGGTDYVTGQAHCFEIDANHPLISGMLQPVEGDTHGQDDREGAQGPSRYEVRRA